MFHCDSWPSPHLVFTNALEWHVWVCVWAVLLSPFGIGTVTENCMHRAHTLNLQPQTSGKPEARCTCALSWKFPKPVFLNHGPSCVLNTHRSIIFSGHPPNMPFFLLIEKPYELAFWCSFCNSWQAFNFLWTIQQLWILPRKGEERLVKEISYGQSNAEKDSIKILWESCLTFSWH